MDNELFHDSFMVERKFIDISLRQNDRGMFVRVGETAAG